MVAYTITWIHPDFNSKFCHYYESVPGDQPNFYVRRWQENGRAEDLTDIETVDDLLYWLSVGKHAL